VIAAAVPPGQLETSAIATPDHSPTAVSPVSPFRYVASCLTASRRHTAPGNDRAMAYFIVKILLSGIIIAAVSEIAKRSPAFGALIVSLPLVSLLGILWLWRDTRDIERIAGHAEATFWYVLPSLPMFLVMPAMLRAGVGFWLSLGTSCALTIVLYFITAWSLSKFGINL
jgi:hypothetical protein